MFPMRACAARLFPKVRADMRSSRFARVFLLPAIATLAPAFAADPAAVPANAPLVPEAPLSADAYYSVNSSARGLAGLPALTDRGATTWQVSPEWRDYQDWINDRWAYIQRVRLTAMRAWATADLAALQAKSSTVYYPFSGADFLYVNAVFPDSKYLLMAGLEPVGTMPDLTTLKQQGRLGPYLQDVRTSLATILAASFFKTKDMKSDFNNQLVDGLLPDIAVFLARDGYTIDSLQFVTLGHDGTLHLHGPTADAGGVQITYFKGDRSNLQYLFYFRTDLGNDGVKSNPGFVNLMHRLGPGVTYLKAASYLLYEDYFSSIRGAILDNSAGVVEDDSGIPLRDFRPSQWAISLYGNYVGPINLFKNYNQPDLTQLYATNPHPALTFGSGYQYQSERSSLLVATKK